MYPNKPLAERMRPQTLNEYVGQKHLTGSGAALQKALASGRIPSMILWGPPGVGKTTLAYLIAKASNREIFMLSAVHSGVKDVAMVIEKAKKQRFFDSPSPILFIDEIHRFNKAQQDSLLGAVEQGVFTLIGATTENPSFEVIAPLLSRCQVYILKHLEKEDLLLLLDFVIKNDVYCKTKKIELQETEALVRFAAGDARKLINIIEIVVLSDLNEETILVTNEKVTDLIQQNIAMYDKNGELHYDIISAFIKSIRGSDPNAALYWLARMLIAGEDLKFIARRLIISAAEDIGLANPNALLLANNCFQAIDKVGMPESRIILSETTIYLATSPKSNSAYLAIDKAMELAAQTSSMAVPLHLRNAPTKLMKNLGYGKNYKYSHNESNNFSMQEYLPQEISGTTIYDPQNNQKENEIQKWLKSLWEEQYNY